MLNTENYPEIPEHLVFSLVRFAEFGIPTGGFLRAILSNDLFGAYRQADSASLEAIGSIVKFVYNEMPCTCSGSESVVDAWIDRKFAESNAAAAAE